MQAKIFKVLDEGTELEVVAVKLTGDTVREQAVLKRAGYYGAKSRVMLWPTTGKHASTKLDWQDSTMTKAHLYLQEYFDELDTGEEIRIPEILSDIGWED